jgi:hypothetical protein
MDNAKGSKMNEPKPLALRLADEMESNGECISPSAELRRLYHEVQRLQDKLDDIDYQNSMNA